MSTEQSQPNPHEIAKSKPLEIKSDDGEVILRQFRLVDSMDIFRLIDRNREHLSRHAEETSQKYQTLDSVVESIAKPANPNRLRMAIRNRVDQLVGSINLTPDEDNPKRGEIGYYLDQRATGRGYTTQAVQTLTEYAFSKMGYQEIYGNVATTNIPSQNVLKRAGYVETGKHVDQKKGIEMIEYSRKVNRG